MVYILRSGRSSSRAPSRISREDSYRQQLLGDRDKPGMIERGALTDHDINYVLKSNDPKLLDALDKKYKKEKANSDHVKRIHGNVFDNKDNNGNLYKDVATDFDPSKTDVNRKNVDQMKTILNTPQK